MGNHWTLQDADENFSAVVEAARRGEPQHLTDEGAKMVVVLSAAEFARLTGQELAHAEQEPPGKSFVQHLLDFPELPEGMEDIFDFEDRPQLKMRNLEFDNGEGR